jgi:integrase
MRTRTRKSAAPGHVRQRGKDSWQVLVEGPLDPLTGRRRRFARTVRGTRADAERTRAELIGQLGSGRLQHANPKATLSEVIERWLGHVEDDLAPKTVYGYRHIHDRYLRVGIGTRPIAKITPVLLDDFYSRLRDEGLSAKTIRNVHGLIRRTLGQAVRWGWATQNPAELATPPRLNVPEVHPPSPDQVHRLLDVALERDPAFGVFLWLAATTGGRRGELAALRWSDVDFDACQLLIERSLYAVEGRTAEKTTKTGRARRIALGNATLAIVRDHRARAKRHAREHGTKLRAEDYLFPAVDGGAMHPDTFTQRFRRLCASLAIQCRLHDLRHYVATEALAAGVPVRTVSGRLGHANPATTHNVYAHFIEASDRDAAAALDALMTRKR